MISMSVYYGTAIVRSSLTCCVILVGKIGPILGTGHKNTPKRTTNSTLSQSRDINVTGEFVRNKSFGEVAIIYAVVEEFPDQDRKVIMTVCSKTSVINRG